MKIAAYSLSDRFHAGFVSKTAAAPAIVTSSATAAKKAEAPAHPTTQLLKGLYARPVKPTEAGRQQQLVTDLENQIHWSPHKGNRLWFLTPLQDPDSIYRQLRPLIGKHGLTNVVHALQKVRNLNPEARITLMYLLCERDPSRKLEVPHNFGSCRFVLSKTKTKSSGDEHISFRVVYLHQDGTVASTGALFINGKYNRKVRLLLQVPGSLVGHMLEATLTTFFRSWSSFVAITDVSAPTFFIEQTKQITNSKQSAIPELAAIVADCARRYKFGTTTGKDIENQFPALIDQYGLQRVMSKILAAAAAAPPDAILLAWTVAKRALAQDTDERVAVKVSVMLYSGERRSMTVSQDKRKTIYLQVHSADNELILERRYLSFGQEFREEFKGNLVSLQDRRGDRIAWQKIPQITPSWSIQPGYIYADGTVMRLVTDKQGRRNLIPKQLPSTFDDRFLLSDTIKNFVDSEDWFGLMTFRQANLAVLQTEATWHTMAAALVNWQPDLDALRMFHDLLENAEHATVAVSPSTNAHLRNALALLGPAWSYTAILQQSLSVRFTPWGSFSRNLDFIASSMPRIGGGYREQTLGDKASQRNILFHQEAYERPRQFFVTQQQEFVHGLSLAFRRDVATGSASRETSNKLLAGLLDFGPCADGRSQAMVDGLHRLGLLTDLGRRVADLTNKSPREQSDEYLRIFRDERLKHYAEQHDLRLDESPRIEQQQDFIDQHFNLRAFARYLDDVGFKSKLTEQQFQDVLAYQQEIIGVLEP